MHLDALAAAEWIAKKKRVITYFVKCQKLTRQLASVVGYNPQSVVNQVTLVKNMR